MDKTNRSSRIKNWSLGDFYFFPNKNTEDFLPDEIPLANLSETGLGLWIQDTRVYLAPGTVLSGVIKSSDIEFFVEIKIIRKSNFIYGCNFLKPVENLGDYLDTHYSIEKKADGMISVNKSLLAPKQEGTPHWHSDGFSELYYIDNDKLLHYYRINYRDIEIERIFDPAKHFKNLGGAQAISKSGFNEIERFLHHINALPFEIANIILDDLQSLVE